MDKPWLAYVDSYVQERSDNIVWRLLEALTIDLQIKVGWFTVYFTRMECLYRLLYSALAIQWKILLMSSNSYLFPYLLTSDQECFCMTALIAFTSLGSRIYYSGGTLLRYWYVKSSLKPEVTAGFNSRKIIYMCLLVPQFLLFLHLIDGFWVYNTKDNVPILLYQACIDPKSDFSVPFLTAMPFQVIMSYIYIFVMVYNNMYLYWYLR